MNSGFSPFPLLFSLILHSMPLSFGENSKQISQELARGWWKSILLYLSSDVFPVLKPCGPVVSKELTPGRLQICMQP